MTQNQKYLRAYIRIQAVLLCLILGAFGASLASQRTREMADGVQASAQRETALPQAIEALSRWRPDKPDWKTVTPYLSALPAPFGCAVGVVYAAWELCQTFTASRSA